MIVIVRKARMQNQAFASKIRIDGQLVGKVRHNCSEQFEVSAGRHVVQTSLGGGRSKKVEVDVAEGGYHVLVTGPSKAGWLTIFPYVLFVITVPLPVGHMGPLVAALLSAAVLLTLSSMMNQIPGLFTTLEPAPEPNGVRDLEVPARRDLSSGTTHRY